jgi:DNA-binding response OmpR family regulator
MILIVDDFADGAESLCRLLTATGYDCRWVAGGREALASIRSHPAEMPLLVVLDEMMPDLSGVEVLQAMRADPRTVQTPVIMYSAGFDVAKEDLAKVMGALAWIPKGSGNVVKTLQSIGEWYERVGGVKQQRVEQRDEAGG